MSVSDNHEQKETLSVDVIIPGHNPRGAATPLFIRTRKELLVREEAECWLSGMTADDARAPLEAHHYPVERCFAEAWDWVQFSKECIAGHWGPYAQAFDWAAFFVGATTVTVAADLSDPSSPVPEYSYLKVTDPYVFVDDMTVNGRLLAKQFHTGKDEGVHNLPEPVWLAQKYLVEGYKFSPSEIIRHAR